MYQVVEMYGDNEPWWFFEDWRQDIRKETVFATIEEAKRFYTQEWVRLSKNYPQHSGKQNFLSAFWSDSDERWCEECDDYLQQYTGLALLKDYQAVTETSDGQLYEDMHPTKKIRCCQLFSQHHAV